MSKWYINENGEIVTKGTNLVKVSVGYDKGGYSYFTGENNPRGYYVYVHTGVEVGDMFERSVLFKGFKVCIREVKRASDKACKLTEEGVSAEIGRMAEVSRGEGGEEKKKNAVGAILLGLKAA